MFAFLTPVGVRRHGSAMLLLPFTIPLIAAGIGLMIVFGHLRFLGQVWPVGLACAVINLPFMIWSVTSSINGLDPDLEKAAANCGAPPVPC
jgi:putative spermidine/putrescine transport system permease protein